MQFGCQLEFVTNKSQEGSQFCRGFGGIGGILRYSVDTTLNEVCWPANSRHPPCVRALDCLASLPGYGLCSSRAAPGTCALEVTMHPDFCRVLCAGGL